MKTPDIGLALTFGALAVATVWSVAAAGPSLVPVGAPTSRTEGGSVGSGACRSCHPGEYATWHASFHRTMTRLATPGSVAGPFDGTRVESEGRTIELSQRGDELYAKLPDPDAVAALTRRGASEPSRDAPLVSRRVVLATGSHHHEVYWVAGAENELRLVPITYLVAERRFIPRRDAFLQPPDAAPHAVRWNSNCIQCHATHGRPGHDEKAGRFASGAAELGIACEACHGPGEAHVQKHRNPVTRYAAHFSKATSQSPGRGTPDETITNPARLAHDRASEVCGQCHSYFVPRDESGWWKDGFASSYRPGDPLDRSRLLLGPADFRADSVPMRGVGAVAEAESAFWGDGTMRVGGREQSALRVSGCYTGGAEKERISCLSCHSMHESDPDDQLRRGDYVNAACRRCHEPIAKRATEHSRHRASSSGNSCVACHMPFTAYALFKGIRSHRIDSPTAAETERPNACNLCHLDRSLDWTQATLAAWFGTAPNKDAGAMTPSPPSTQKPTPLAVELLLSGDAAERAIAAWAFGLTETREASGGTWQAPYLAALLDDPYSAVRFIAARSLRTFPEFSRLDYDFLAPKERRLAVREGILSRFHSERPHIEALLARQDARPVSISE